jgi:hypothetical protein
MTLTCASEWKNRSKVKALEADGEEIVLIMHRFTRIKTFEARCRIALAAGGDQNVWLLESSTLPSDSMKRLGFGITQEDDRKFCMKRDPDVSIHS